MALPFRKQFVPLIVAIVLYIWFCAYPILVVVANQAPMRGDLVRMHARIINIGIDHPNLTIELNDRSIQKVDFVGDFYRITSFDSRFTWLGVDKMNRVKGCNAELAGSYTKLFPFRQFRVWDLRCNGVVWSYDDSLKYFKLVSRTGGWVSLAENILMLTFTALLFTWILKYEQRN